MEDCIKRGDLSGVKRLLLEDVESLNARYGELERPALLIAVEEGQVEIVLWLLSYGADSNAKNKWGSCGLIVVGRTGDIAIAQALVDFGAEVNVQNRFGWTGLMNASKLGHVEMTQFLLENGASVDLKTTSSWTALLLACKQGHLEIARLLVENGRASVNMQDRRGETALMIACEEGYVDLARFLLESKAEVEVLSNAGLDALEYARKSGQEDLVAFLECLMYSEMSRTFQIDLGLPPSFVLACFDSGLNTLESCKQSLNEVDLDNLLSRLCSFMPEVHRQRVKERLLYGTVKRESLPKRIIRALQR